MVRTCGPRNWSSARAPHDPRSKWHRHGERKILMRSPAFRAATLLAVAFSCLFAGRVLSAQSLQLDKDTPVTLYKNARIYTNDPRAPWAAAMLVRGEEILAIGEEDEVSALVEKGTNVVD